MTVALIQRSSDIKTQELRGAFSSQNRGMSILGSHETSTPKSCAPGNGLTEKGYAMVLSCGNVFIVQESLCRVMSRNKIPIPLRLE
jgi:hypothetical protein